MPDDLLSKALDFLKKVFPAVKLIYLFCSYAHGQNTADSDLDLAIHNQGRIDPVKLFKAARELENILGIDIDLIDLSTGQTTLNFQIIQTGQVAFAADNLFKEIFEISVFSEYVDFNERRADILENYQVRK